MNNFDLALERVWLSLQVQLNLLGCSVSNDLPISIELLNQSPLEELLHLLCAAVVGVVGLKGTDSLEDGYLGTLIGADAYWLEGIIDLLGLLGLGVTVRKFMHLYAEVGNQHMEDIVHSQLKAAVLIPKATHQNDSAHLFAFSECSLQIVLY